MNTTKKEYLKKTLVDAGRRILKDQSYVYTEAEDKDMVDVIKQMMKDEESCYAVARRVLRKASKDDNLMFEALSLTMDNFVNKKSMEAPDELQYFKDVQKVCKMVNEFSKLPNNDTGSNEFKAIRNFCEERDIPLNTRVLCNKYGFPSERLYRLTVNDNYEWDLVEIQKNYIIW